jgi:hypothetical protein
MTIQYFISSHHAGSNSFQHNIEIRKSLCCSFLECLKHHTWDALKWEMVWVSEDPSKTNPKRVLRTKPPEYISRTQQLHKCKFYAWDVSLDEIKELTFQDFQHSLSLDASETIKNCGFILEHIPLSIITSCMCLDAMKSGNMLEHVPKSLRSQAVYEAFIKQNPHMFEIVPNHFKTEDMCLEVVQKNGCLIRHVPEKLKTSDVCSAAFKEYPYAFQHFPESMKTVEMCWQVFNTNKLMKIYIPEDTQKNMGIF